MEKRIIEKLALRIAELEMNLAMAQAENEQLRESIIEDEEVMCKEN